MAAWGRRRRDRDRPPGQNLLRPGLVDRLAQRQAQLFPDHSEQIEAGDPRRRIEEGTSAAAKLDDREAVRDHHAGRGELGQDEPIDFAVDILRDGRPQRRRDVGRCGLGGPEIGEVDQLSRRGRRARIDPVRNPPSSKTMTIAIENDERRFAAG